LARTRSFGHRPGDRARTKELVIGAMAVIYTLFPVLYVVARRENSLRAFRPWELALCVVIVVGDVMASATTRKCPAGYERAPEVITDAQITVLFNQNAAVRFATGDRRTVGISYSTYRQKVGQRYRWRHVVVGLLGSGIGPGGDIGLCRWQQGRGRHRRRRGWHSLGDPRGQ